MFNKKEWFKEYRLKNKEKIKEYGKEYRLKNKEKIKESAKIYSLTHKERLCEYLVRYRQINKEKVADYRTLYKPAMRKWRELNQGKILGRNRKWLKLARAKLRDFYIKDQLKRRGIHKIDDRLIQMKREQVKLFRNLKKLKEVYNESNYSNTEGIESKAATSYQAQNNSG